MTKRRSVFVAFASAMATAITGGRAGRRLEQRADADGGSDLALHGARTPDIDRRSRIRPTRPTDPPPGHIEVKPDEFDPGHTLLVQAEWSGADGLSERLRSTRHVPGRRSRLEHVHAIPACPTSDHEENDENDGLVPRQDGADREQRASPSRRSRASRAPVTELGYDIRKRAQGTRASAERLALRRRSAAVRRLHDRRAVLRRLPVAAAQRRRTTAVRRGSGCAGGRRPCGVIGLQRVDRPTRTDHRAACNASTSSSTRARIQAPTSSARRVLDNIDVNGILGGTGPDDNEP